MVDTCESCDRGGRARRDQAGREVLLMQSWT